MNAISLARGASPGWVDEPGDLWGGAGSEGESGTTTATTDKHRAAIHTSLLGAPVSLPAKGG